MNGFNDFPYTMVITLKSILTGTKPILYVSHDEEDGMWQFLDGSVNLDINNARIVGLKKILRIDASITLLGDLPLGWIAERDNKNAIWIRQKKYKVRHSILS